MRLYLFLNENLYKSFEMYSIYLNPKKGHIHRFMLSGGLFLAWIADPKAKNFYISDNGSMSHNILLNECGFKVANVNSGKIIVGYTNGKNTYDISGGYIDGTYNLTKSGRKKILKTDWSFLSKYLPTSDPNYDVKDFFMDPDI